MKPEFYSNDLCRHCGHNPKPEKPVNDMHRIRIDAEIFALAEKYATEHGIKVPCMLCQSTRLFLESKGIVA
jgi:hypothetical protein